MTFKEFVNWCNDRACDGKWGMLEAIACVEIIRTVRRKLPWRRERFWRERYKGQVTLEIVRPINERILRESKGEWEKT